MFRTHFFHRVKLFVLTVLTILTVTSCSKDEKFKYEGTVVNINNEPVVSAKIQIFESAQDWLTGRNVIATMTSDKVGYFKSGKIFEAGDYFIFVEKLDSSNWVYRDVEQGIYPKVSIPEDGGKSYTVEFNNMALLARTNWVLTNLHKEYTKPGATAVEWQSIWTSVNNCRRDNYIKFNSDLTMTVSEGKSVCSGKKAEVEARFIPPMIMGKLSCSTLPNSSQDVKEFEYFDWPELKAKNGKMFLDCNQSIGQLYIMYTDSKGLTVLEVYTRRN
jgi:hypothetical protein